MERKVERLHIDMVPEGQRQLFDLCGDINLWYLNLRENGIQSASSSKMLTLLEKTATLYDQVDATVDFDINDNRSLKLIKQGSVLKRRYNETRLSVSTAESEEVLQISLTENVIDPHLVSKQLSSYVSHKGYRFARASAKWATPKEAPAYGDSVAVSASRNMEGHLAVEYKELFADNHFKSHHLSQMVLNQGKVDLTAIRALFGDDVIKFPILPEIITPGVPIYSIGREYLDNIQFSSRFHDYGGIDYYIDVNCNTTEEVEKVSKYFLQAIVDHPRELKVST